MKHIRDSNSSIVEISKRTATRSLIAIYLLSAAIVWLSHSWVTFIFGLLFAIFIPGLVILLGLKRAVSIGWESIVITAGIGLTFDIIIGLAGNILFHLLGIDAPLSPSPLFSMLAVSTVSIGLFSYIRWSQHPLCYKSSRVTRHEIGVLILALMVLVGSVLGAIRLNNGASGWLTIAAYIMACFTMLILYVRSKKYKSSVIISALWMIGLGLIFSGWLRSKYVAGPDVDIEFRIFQAVKSSGYWSIDTYRNAYNACLSIGILPVILQYATKIPDLLVFKILMPAIYSLIIPIVFLVLRPHYSKKVAIISTFFFFSQPPFTTWWWIPIRQQIAFLLFALIVLVIIKHKNSLSSRAMFIILGIGMALAHYSTTYIAIGLFGMTVLVRLCAKLFFRKRLQISPILISPKMLLILFIFTFLWYSQLTYGFNGITSFATKSIQNIGTLFSDDVQQNGQKPLDRFNIFSNAGGASLTTEDYLTARSESALQQYKNGELYSQGKQYDVSTPGYFNYSSPLGDKVNLLRNLLKVAGNVLICGGIIIIAFRSWRKRELTVLSMVQIAAFTFLGLVLFLPFFSVSYGPDRLYQQLLVILACAVGVVSTIRIPHICSFKWLTLLFAVSYFVVLNQLLFHFTDTSQKNLVFDNSGTQYLTYSITEADAKAAEWLYPRSESSLIYSDAYSQYRLISTTDLSILQKLKSGVIPNVITKQSYVYQSTANTKSMTGFDRYQGDVLYKFPVDFLKTEKNTVYSNGNDKIYR